MKVIYVGWFDKNQKPVRVGEYDVISLVSGSYGAHKAKWDGTFWEVEGNPILITRWRGITEACYLKLMRKG